MKQTDNIAVGVKKEEEPPMPWKDLIITLIVVSCEAFTSNIITPFVTEMCKTRFGIPEAYVGFASGVLVGIFAFASFFAGFILGHLSDKFGRKYPMLLGLCSGVVCTLWFAISTNFWIALTARFMAGFTNANIGITKAVISDLATGKNRSVAYVYQGATFAGMRAVSSAVSGLLSGMLLFGLSDNPYLLPCFVVAVFNAVGIIIVFFLFRETAKSVKPATRDNSKYTTLDNQNISHRRHNVDSNDKCNALIELDNIEECESSDEEEAAKQRKTTSQQISDEELEESYSASKQGCFRRFTNKITSSSFVKGLSEAAKDKLIRKVVFVLVLNSTMNGCILIALVLLFTLPIDMNGLGFSTFEMGMAYMYLGGTGFIIQVFGAKRVVRFGVMNTYSSGCFSQFFGTFLISLIPLTYYFFGFSTTTHYVVWVEVVIFVLVLSYGYVSALPVLSTMLANSSSPSCQGLIQGSVQSLASLLRAFGPVASGAIFSLSLIFNCPYLLFYCIAFGYFVCFFVCMFFFSKEDKMICDMGRDEYFSSLMVVDKHDLNLSSSHNIVIVEEKNVTPLSPATNFQNNNNGNLSSSGGNAAHLPYFVSPPNKQ